MTTKVKVLPLGITGKWEVVGTDGKVLDIFDDKELAEEYAEKRRRELEKRKKLNDRIRNYAREQQRKRGNKVMLDLDDATFREVARKIYGKGCEDK